MKKIEATTEEAAPPRIVYEYEMEIDDQHISKERIVLIDDMGLPQLCIEELELDAMGEERWAPIKSSARKCGVLERALLSKEGVDLKKLVKAGLGWA